MGSPFSRSASRTAAGSKPRRTRWSKSFLDLETGVKPPGRLRAFFSRAASSRAASLSPPSPARAFAATAPTTPRERSEAATRRLPRPRAASKRASSAAVRSSSRRPAPASASRVRSTSAGSCPARRSFRSSSRLGWARRPRNASAAVRQSRRGRRCGSSLTNGPAAGSGSAAERARSTAAPARPQVWFEKSKGDSSPSGFILSGASSDASISSCERSDVDWTPWMRSLNSFGFVDRRIASSRVMSPDR